MVNEKRLTEKHYDGKGYYLKCSEECHLVDLSCEDCVEMQKLVDRLGEHEDKTEQTVDSVEVVHGRWDVEVGMNYNKERICPVCKNMSKATSGTTAPTVVQR